MAKNTNTITLEIPDEQIEALRAIPGLAVILGLTEPNEPAVMTPAGDRPRDAKGRFLPADGKGKKGKAAKPARKAKKTAAQKASAARSRKFYDEVIVGGREARKARQSSNSEMAKWMRKNGLVPNGSAWELAKHGERSVAVLRRANTADKKAAKKAAKATK